MNSDTAYDKNYDLAVDLLAEMVVAYLVKISDGNKKIESKTGKEQ